MPRSADSARNLRAQRIENPRLVVPDRRAVGTCRRGRIGAPRPAALLLHHVEQRLAHLRKQMHVLMAVDEIRRAPELARRRHRAASRSRWRAARGRAAAARPRTIISASETNVPRRVGRKPALIGLNRAGERDMQADRDPARAGVEHLQRTGFGAVEARRRHHDRGGVEPALHHELADRLADSRRDAVVVGAQPDRPDVCARAATLIRRRCEPARAGVGARPCAVRTLCSATK